MGKDREPILNRGVDLPKMADGSGDEPFVSKSAMRRKVSRHAQLHHTLQVIRNFDPSDLPHGEGRGFRNIDKK